MIRAGFRACTDELYVVEGSADTDALYEICYIRRDDQITNRGLIGTFMPMGTIAAGSESAALLAWIDNHPIPSDVDEVTASPLEVRI